MFHFVTSFLALPEATERLPSEAQARESPDRQDVVIHYEKLHCGLRACVLSKALLAVRR